MKVEDRTHPSTKHLEEQWVMNDEIYQFKWYRRHPNHVLISLDTDAFDVSRGKRADKDYANSWCKDQGQGKMFYTALGHREDVWTNPLFQEHLISGIEWAVNGPSLSTPAPEGATVLDRGTGGASPAMGFRAIGGQAVRMDLIERISKAAHDARQGRKPFAPDPALAVSIGLKPETLDRLMARLGFRATSPHEGAPRWIWRGRPAPRREKPAAPRPENAFAALADLDLRNG